jgi:hypothetical protein
MRHVPGLDRAEQSLCPKPEYRSTGFAGAAGGNVLHDFCSGFPSSEIGVIERRRDQSLKERTWTIKAS